MVLQVPGACVVNLGDVLDCSNKERGGIFRQVLLWNELRLANPTQVDIVLGNRDVNKLRLPADLRDPCCCAYDNRSAGACTNYFHSILSFEGDFHSLYIVI